MNAVLINQTQVTLGKGDVIAKNSLAEMTIYDICQFDVVVGVELGFLAVCKMMAAAERLRGGAHGSIKLMGAADVPAQCKDPFLLHKGIGLYLLCGFGIFRAD